MARIRKAFLSSTGADLKEYRAAAHAAINALDDWKCVWMEDFGARDWNADSFCRAKVAECDLSELARLRQELLNGSYQPGPYRQFWVRENKPRLISAAPFRDRVVHHALTQVLEPIWERRFSKDSFACRTGFGVHKALQRAKRPGAAATVDVTAQLGPVLHEQLRYLIEFADQERDRFERVKSVLMESFN